MRERFLIGRKEGWDRYDSKENIRRGVYFVRVDHCSLSMRLIPSSEVSERSSNCHVCEPAYKNLHGACSNEGVFEIPSFVTPALLR